MFETVLLNIITFFSYFSSDYLHTPKILTKVFFHLSCFKAISSEADFPAAQQY